MSKQSHFTFEGRSFDNVTSHGGLGTVRTERVLKPSENSGIAFLDLTEVPVGSSIGLHRHGYDDEEIYVVVSGRGRVTLEDQTFPVGPGHVIINKPGGTHALENIGDDTLKIVVVDVCVPSDSIGLSKR